MQYLLEKQSKKYHLKMKPQCNEKEVALLFKSIGHILNCHSTIIKSTSFEIDTPDLVPFQYNNRLFGDYRKNIILIWNLIKQQQFLEKRGYGFYGFSPEEDVIWDNKNTFFIANPKRILPILSEKGIMQFDVPFDKRNLFCSPELLSVRSLPARVHYKTIYYSIAAFITYNMFGKVVENSRASVPDFEELEEESKKTHDILHQIKYTKLYWLLVKMLNITPENRHCLFV
jgi:hypothetical protein